MRTVAVVTASRSDYGIYRPILNRIIEGGDLRLYLMVTGMHLSPEFGLTVRGIEEDGFPISERIETLVSSDEPVGVAKSMALGTLGFADVFSRFRPDILLVLGDRFEMHAAAVAALPFKIPIAHIHGGELTEGAIDDALRHSITKLSHLHFVSTEKYRQRLIQMGEEPWRVVVSGAPSLDGLRKGKLLSRRAIEKLLGFQLGDGPFLLVTLHPVTLEYEQSESQVSELLAALDECGLPCVFTMPNADTRGRSVNRLLADYVEQHPTSACLAANLGTQGYFSLMALAAAMVGNSSSGITEAPSFELPVVNVGSRQTGRIKGMNVIDVKCSRASIRRGLRKALSEEFRASLQGMANPYQKANASKTIVEVLGTVPLDEKLIVKRFHDSTVAVSGGSS